MTMRAQEWGHTQAVRLLGRGKTRRTWEASTEAAIMKDKTA